MIIKVTSESCKGHFQPPCSFLNHCCYTVNSSPKLFKLKWILRIAQQEKPALFSCTDYRSFFLTCTHGILILFLQFSRLWWLAKGTRKLNSRVERHWSRICLGHLPTHYGEIPSKRIAMCHVNTSNTWDWLHKHWFWIPLLTSDNKQCQISKSISSVAKVSGQVLLFLFHW